MVVEFTKMVVEKRYHRNLFDTTKHKFSMASSECLVIGEHDVLDEDKIPDILRKVRYDCPKKLLVKRCGGEMYLSTFFVHMSTRRRAEYSSVLSKMEFVGLENFSSSIMYAIADYCTGSKCLTFKDFSLCSSSKYILHCLTKAGGVTNLTLSNVGYTGTDLRELFNMNKTVHTLTLTHVRITDQECEAFEVFLTNEEDGGVRSLSLIDSYVTYSMFESLVSWRMPLRYLRLERCEVTDFMLEEFGKIHNNHKIWNHVSLRDNYITSEGVQHLVGLRFRDEVYRDFYLDLSHNVEIREDCLPSLRHIKLNNPDLFILLEGCGVSEAFRKNVERSGFLLHPWYDSFMVFLSHFSDVNIPVDIWKIIVHFL